MNPEENIRVEPSQYVEFRPHRWALMIVGRISFVACLFVVALAIAFGRRMADGSPEPLNRGFMIIYPVVFFCLCALVDMGSRYFLYTRRYRIRVNGQEVIGLSPNWMYGLGRPSEVTIPLSHLDRVRTVRRSWWHRLVRKQLLYSDAGSIIEVQLWCFDDSETDELLGLLGLSRKVSWAQSKQ